MQKQKNFPTPLAWCKLLVMWLTHLVLSCSLFCPKLSEAEPFVQAFAFAESISSPAAASQSPAATTPAPLVTAAAPVVLYQALPALNCTLRGDAPCVLIYHTHDAEAYTQTATYPYTRSGQWRTMDETRSVIAVGEALAKCLREVYGVSVLHDTTRHECGKLATAYSRSEITLRKALAAYPSLVLVIDLHRDAYTVTDEPTTDFVSLNGQELARVMCVVGRGDNYEEKPRYAQNYNLAASLTRQLKAMDSRLARPVRVKAGRYNQHLAPYSLLLEVGHNANTLEQALAVTPYLAEAIVVAMAEQAEGVSELSLSLTP